MRMTLSSTVSGIRTHRCIRIPRPDMKRLRGTEERETIVIVVQSGEAMNSGLYERRVGGIRWKFVRHSTVAPRSCGREVEPVR